MCAWVRVRMCVHEGKHTQWWAFGGFRTSHASCGDSLYGLQGWNSGHEAWFRYLSPTESSCWSDFKYFINTNFTRETLWIMLMPWYPGQAGTRTTHPSQFLVFQGQDPCAFCEEFHFDHRPRMGGAEIALSSPSAIKEGNNVFNMQH